MRVEVEPRPAIRGGASWQAPPSSSSPCRGRPGGPRWATPRPAAGEGIRPPGGRRRPLSPGGVPCPDCVRDRVSV